MEQELEILQGAVSAVVYQNYENGYAVLRLNLGGGQTVTVVGTIPLPAVGERLMVTGKWSTHSNYGRQFEAEFLERLMPQTSVEILNYLSSRVIKGIGPRTASRIVEMFGDQTLAIMEREPERLSEVPGISREKARKIGEEFKLHVGIRQIMEFFALHHLSAELAVQVYKRYGDSTMELLYDDPYLLMDEELNASFGAVDQFAISLGVAGDDPRRVEAGTLFELSYNLTGGHCFLPEEKLIAATARLLQLDSDEPVKQGIARLLEADRLVRERLAGITVIYLPELHEAETECTRMLLDFAGHSFPEPRGLDRQDSGHCQGKRHRVFRRADPGHPGGGHLRSAADYRRPRYRQNHHFAGYSGTFRPESAPLPAGRAYRPGGQAADGGHRGGRFHHPPLLEAGIDPATGKMFFARDAENPLKCDAVIVDEMSMVDVSLLYSLLQAIPTGKRLILVGDPDQLPPVGPGFPFGDSCEAEAFPPSG